MTFSLKQRNKLNWQLFRDAKKIYMLVSLLHESAVNIGEAHGAAAAEEVVELRVGRPYWMEENPKVVSGEWLSVTALRDHAHLGSDAAVLRLDVREAPADTAVAPPAGPCNNIEWERFWDAVCGGIGFYESLLNYNRASSSVVLLVPLQDDLSTHVPAVISDCELDSEGWKTRIRIEAELIEDVKRQVKRYASCFG